MSLPASAYNVCKLTWIFDPEAKRFTMDVSYGFEPQPHSIGTAWAKEMHLSTTGDGTWTLDMVSINAPGYPDVENLGGRVVLNDTVATGADVCALLVQGHAFAECIQSELAEEVAAS